MHFSHCDSSEKHLSLHDCIAEQAYFKDGVLGFDFSNGFWILSDHPESHLSQTVRTDFSRAEFILENGEAYDVTVYVFSRTWFKKNIGTEWPLQKLIDRINSGKCRLEFLYQYIDGNARIIECELRSEKRPYRRECLIQISAPKVNYSWNKLCEDKPW